MTEFDEADWQRLSQELQEQRLLADVGEAAAVYLHDLGNAFNNILLDMRLLQRQLPEEHKDRLAESCAVVVAAAKQMHQVSQYRQGCRAQPYSIDLAGLLTQFVRSTERWQDRVKVRTPEHAVLVMATVSGLKRILRLLLDNLLKPLSAEEVVSLHLRAVESSAILDIHSPSPSLTEEEWLGLFEAFPMRDIPSNTLELAVCKNLIRKMTGSLQIKPGEPAGVHLQITFPTRTTN